MSINNITLLPTPVPSRADPLNFATRADAFLGALPTFGTELNTFASEANVLATEVQNNKDASDQTLGDIQALEVSFQDLYDNSLAMNNFKGLWSSLTGALNKPACVFHAGDYWNLLNNLVNVTTSTPSTSNPDWLKRTLPASSVTYDNTGNPLAGTNVQSTIANIFPYITANVNPNYLINPEFLIDQEFSGASVSIPVSATEKYFIDQWYAWTIGAGVTSQQIAGISDRLKSLRFTGASGNTSLTFGQRIESVRCNDLKNQTVTVAFKAKASTNKTISWFAFYANTTDSFATKTQIATGTINVTTTMQTFSFSFNAGANAGNGIALQFNTAGLGAGQTLDFDQIQLEKSSVATIFKAPFIEEQLVMCQRYWENGYLVLRGTHKNINGQVTTTCAFKVTKRVTPTLTNTFTVNSGGTEIQRAQTIYGFEYGMVVAITDSSVMSGNWTASARL